MTSTSRTTSATRRRRYAGAANDQRYAQDALVHEDSVIAFAVIAQRLSVVGGHDDDRSIEELPPLEGFQQTPDLRVGEGDLGDIRIRVSRSEGFGRVVGPVRVVEVRPQKEAGVADPVDPPDRVCHDFIPAPPRRGPCSLRYASIDDARVRIEALCKTAVRIEHDRSDERSGAEPVARTVSASVVCSGESGRSALSRTPWRGGNSPVNRLQCAGNVSGATDVA